MSKINKVFEKNIIKIFHKIFIKNCCDDIEFLKTKFKSIEILETSDLIRISIKSDLSYELVSTDLHKFQRDLTKYVVKKKLKPVVVLYNNILESLDSINYQLCYMVRKFKFDNKMSMSQLSSHTSLSVKDLSEIMNIKFDGSIDKVYKLTLKMGFVMTIKLVDEEVGL